MILYYGRSVWRVKITPGLARAIKPFNWVTPNLSAFFESMADFTCCTNAFNFSDDIGGSGWWSINLAIIISFKTTFYLMRSIMVLVELQSHKIAVIIMTIPWNRITESYWTIIGISVKRCVQIIDTVCLFHKVKNAADIGIFAFLVYASRD